MPIVPDGLQRVTANEAKAAQLKAVRAIADVGPLDITHDVGFTPAARAGAGAAELFQLEVAFAAIVPREREFMTDHFGAEDLQRGRIGHK